MALSTHLSLIVLLICGIAILCANGFRSNGGFQGSNGFRGGSGFRGVGTSVRGYIRGRFGGGYLISGRAGTATASGGYGSSNNGTASR